MPGCIDPPFRWQQAFWGNRADGTDHDASTAVDAACRVDCIAVTTVMDAGHRTDRCAGGIFDTDARLSDHMRHGSGLPGYGIVIGCHDDLLNDLDFRRIARSKDQNLLYAQMVIDMRDAPFGLHDCEFIVCRQDHVH